VIAEVIEPDGATYLALLAAKLAAREGVVALLAGRATGHVVFAQSKGGARDMGTLLRETFREVAGKGGGSRHFAQGSLAEAARAEELVKGAKAKLGG